MIALDTNILAYAVTPSDTNGRHEAAITLLERVASQGAIIPLPVFGEFFNACRKKKLASSDIAESRVAIWLSIYDCPASLAADYVAASSMAHRYPLQYFDALIVTVAHRAGATILLSEDMHDGLDVDGVRIVNPFEAANDRLIAAALR